MRIVNLKKFLKSLFVILLVIFVLSLICAKASLSHREVEYTTLYVTSGDTLWNIANDLQINNSYYKGKDIREIVSSIKDMNNLKSSNLYVNQELIIPIM